MSILSELIILKNVTITNIDILRDIFKKYRITSNPCELLNKTCVIYIINNDVHITRDSINRYENDQLGMINHIINSYQTSNIHIYDFNEYIKTI